jgi:hypothetical protein
VDSNHRPLELDALSSTIIISMAVAITAHCAIEPDGFLEFVFRVLRVGSTSFGKCQSPRRSSCTQ